MNKILITLIFSLYAVVTYSTTAYDLEPITTYETDLVQRLSNIELSNPSSANYDPITGTLSFSETDIDIPGNFDLPVRLTRWISDENFATGGPKGWMWNIPVIRGYYRYSINNDNGWVGGKNCDGTVGATAYSDTSGHTRYIKPSTFWDGKVLHIPGKTTERLLYGDGTTLGTPYYEKQFTKSNYYIKECIYNSSGEQGIVVKAPNGDEYSFNNFKTYNYESNGDFFNAKYTKLLLITEVKDKFGNIVSYNYDNSNNLTSIEASDGRKIEIAYHSNGLANYATAHGKKWDYIETEGQGLKVELPDGRYWEYPLLFSEFGFNKSSSRHGYSNYRPSGNGQPLEPIAGYCEKGSNTLERTYTIKNPNGLITTFYVNQVYHGITGVEPDMDKVKVKDIVDKNGDGFRRFTRKLNCDVEISLLRKKVEGPGVVTQNIYYDYSENTGKYLPREGLNLNSELGLSGYSFVSPAEGLPETVSNTTDFKTTTVRGPTNIKTYFIGRKDHSITQNRIVAVDIRSISSEQLIKRIEYKYNKSDYLGQHWFKKSAGCTGCGFDQKVVDAIDENIQHRVNTIEVVNKLLYSDRTDKYYQKYLDYDVYGFSRKFHEYNNFNESNRYIKKTFKHEDALWILGLIEEVSISDNDANYTTMSEVIYHDFSNTGLYQSLKVPYEYKQFGEWQVRFKEYHSDGNVKSKEYNARLRSSNGGETSAYRFKDLLNYKRGKAQTISYPERYSSIGKITESRIVNDFGLITEETNLDGHKTKYRYGSGNRLESIITPDSWLDYRLDWSFDLEGRPTVSIKSCDVYYRCISNTIVNEEVNTYDSYGRLIIKEKRDLISNNTKYINFSYNAAGNKVFESYWSLLNNETSGVYHEYDALKRLVISGETEGGSISKSYLSKNRVSITDAESNTTEITYNAYGNSEYNQEIIIDSPENVKTEFDVNLFGNVTSITQSGPGKGQGSLVSQTENRYYDNQQRLCLIKRNDVGDTAYVLNAIGEVVYQFKGVYAGTACKTSGSAGTDPHFIYDNLGSIWKKYYWGKAPDIIHERKPSGLVEKLTSGNVVTDYLYNSLGVLEEETLSFDDQEFRLDYLYSDSGHKRGLVFPNGIAVQYELNGFGGPTSIKRASDSFYYAKDIKYYPSGMVDSFNYGNGLSHKTTLNSRRLPKRIKDFDLTTVALDYEYSYDNNSNIISIADHKDPGYSLSNMAYDGLDRLISTNGNQKIGSSQIRYDGLGNITYYSSKNRVLDYQYDYNKNRLLQVYSTGTESKAYDFRGGYDERGNVLNNGHMSFEYDLSDKLVRSDDTYSFAYDGNGRRVNECGVCYSMYSQSGQLIYRDLPFGSTRISYIYIKNKLIAKDGFFIESKSSQHYRPYGSSIEGEQSGLSYSGHIYDDSPLSSNNLIYMQARYYDPVIGRFYSNDPIGFRDVHSFNRYTYANNNPYRYIDPTGMCSSDPKAGARDQCQNTSNLKLSQQGANHIKNKENPSGRLDVHDDGAGNPTSGYGHKDNSMVIGSTITQQTADSDFVSDVASAEQTVQNLAGSLPLSQNEFDAMTDLAFNVGATTLNSTNSPGLNNAIAAGDYEAISNNLKYTKATNPITGQKVSLPGLVPRSADRRTLFRGNIKYKNP